MPRLRNDRGSAGLVEFALVAPVLLLIVLGGINVALVQHARELATVAAAEAARAAAVSWEGGTTAELAGVAAGRNFLNGAGLAAGVCPGGSGFGTVDVDVAGGVGSDVTAEVDWCYVNLFGGLLTLLGAQSTGAFDGTITMTVRKEGW